MLEPTTLSAMPKPALTITHVKTPASPADHPISDPPQETLVLKPANLPDWQAEFAALRAIPDFENGVENQYAYVDQSYFFFTALPEIINHSEGLGLLPGYVPSTMFFLWAANPEGRSGEPAHIVGQFKLRHYLSDRLRERGGHLGYTILPPYRGRGYATRGLALALTEARRLVREDDLLMTVLKTNTASLCVQLKNGAQIIRETPEYYTTQITLR